MNTALAMIHLSHNPIHPHYFMEGLDKARDMDNLVSSFEKEMATLAEVPHAIAVNSGTAAIHLALLALGVGSGDEVLVSTFTYIASVNPILYVGAKPIFVDCDDVSWNMEPEALAHAITDRIQKGKKPKAIIVVHAYGMPANMKALMEVSQFYGVPILEDAAAGIGSTYYGKALGGQGDIGIFSFNSNKLLTTFGGGAVLVKDEKSAKRLEYLSTHARVENWYYEHREVGYNYKMSPINAGVGLAQIPHLPEYLAKRKRWYELYQMKLSGKGYGFQKGVGVVQSNYWLTAVRLPSDSPSPEIMVALMRDRGIEVRPMFKPMHQQPLFKDSPHYGDPVSEKLFSNGLCLPSGNDLNAGQIEYVAETLMALCEGKI